MWTANLSTKWQSGAAASCLAIVSLATAGCGFSLNEAAIEKMSAIQATGNNLRVTQTMQFKTEAPVIWSVNGIPGGNADIGTISSTGALHCTGHRPSAQQPGNHRKLRQHLSLVQGQLWCFRSESNSYR